MDEEKKLTLRLGEESYTTQKSSVVFPESVSAPSEKGPTILEVVYQEVKSS